MVEATSSMHDYLNTLSEETKKLYDIAKKAREKGIDPEQKVDIPIARNMAERVEGLISAVAPELTGSGMIARILELEKKYGGGAWEVALIIAEEVAKEQFCTFVDKRTAMEVGIRTGMAYSTAGIVAAPLEGFIELKIKKRRDNGEYFSVFYAGPIRGAGGTAASVSVLIADYVRVKLGYQPYDPTEEEVKRYVSEIQDYHERVSNLQYFPSEEEIIFFAQHLPVEVNGDPTEKFDVSNFKDLPRLETNKIRGGMCLVMAEGLAQKSPKLWKRLQKWGSLFGLEHWSFLVEFLAIQKRIKAQREQPVKEEAKPKITPNYTYIKDLVAGRPVLTYPMRRGGFRLRYGRTRTSGFSACAIHPATQAVLKKYIATGTQLKVERPGKAAAVTVCDAIEGPIVKLYDGSVVHLTSQKEAQPYLSQIQEILYLGDILFNYGDFSENGHVLVPAGYCEEWYAAELKQQLGSIFGTKEVDTKDVGIKEGQMYPGGQMHPGFEKIALCLSISAQEVQRFFREPSLFKFSFAQCLTLSSEFSIPLHPQYTYYWNSLSLQQLSLLLEWMKKAALQMDEQRGETTSDTIKTNTIKTDTTNINNIKKIVIPVDGNAKRCLELLGVPHLCVMNEFAVIEQDHARAIAFLLKGKQEDMMTGVGTLLGNAVLVINQEQNSNQDGATPPIPLATTPLQLLQNHVSILLRDKLGTFIGARMGRPEKAKMRKLTGSPQVLFPVGDEGGRLRSFQAALAVGKVTADFPLHKCHACDKESLFPVCSFCKAQTTQIFFCKQCGPKQTRTCQQHGLCKAYDRRSIPIGQIFQEAVQKTGMATYPDLIKGIRGTSNRDHIPEHLAKGILRAKHDVYVNKDGTTRYDMSELPITHFKPMEVGVSVQRLVELGYLFDIYKQPLVNDQQIVELKPQDIILPASPDALDEPADTVLFRVASFIDEELAQLYGLPPFYNLRSKADLTGHLVIGLAPHISAGTIGRIIGFSKTQGMYCHPLYHAAMRRDCDGDEACVILLLDAFLNFSRQYLPDKRGGRTMDSPLVLTTTITPSEVDDQAHGVDVAWEYPLEFYEAAQQYKQPWDVPIEQIRTRLGTELQFEGMGFTIPVSNINEGVTCSAYKTLPSMEEKLLGQMELAEKIYAVDASGVAQMVIEKHFLKDTKGNLRKFSMQQFRCVNCNEKFRRPPLYGKCTKCNGKLLFTVSEGNVLKYMEPSLSLARKYNLPPYLQQVLAITKRRIEGMFGKEKERQEGLGAWFG